MAEHTSKTLKADPEKRSYSVAEAAEILGVSKRSVYNLCAAEAFKTVCFLRSKGIAAETDHTGRSVKAQFKYADKLGVKFVAVIGGDELASGEIKIKNMSSGEQTAVKCADIYAYLTKE